MMKGMLAAVIAASALLVASGAYAEEHKSLHDRYTGQSYGTAGCGLGSVIFGDKEGMVQVLAATINGTFYTQTFGISSGTSNCDEGGKRAENLNLYIEANRVAVANDAARGSGETVADISKVLGCGNAPALGKTLQQNYTKIFPSQDVSSQDVSRSILEITAGCPVS